MAGLQLSKECMDLLNQIFVIDSTKRISLQGIKDHAWYSMPLSEKFKEGEVKIAASQEKIDEYVNSRKISQVGALSGQRHPTTADSQPGRAWRSCPCI